MKEHDFILGIKTPISIRTAKKLIGMDFPVIKTRMSWGEERVILDRLVITDVRFEISAKTGKSVHRLIMVWSDYFLDGKLQYNAWAGIPSVQEYIRNYVRLKDAA